VIWDFSHLEEGCSCRATNEPSTFLLSVCAFALKAFYRKSGLPKIEEFQASKAARSLEKQAHRALSFTPVTDEEPSQMSWRGSLENIVPGDPRERSRLISRIRSGQVCANAKNLLICLGNPCDVALEAQELSGAFTEKDVRKEHECYRYQKANRGNVRNHCRALSRGHAQL
jgi:hypothetical protein